MERPRHLVDSGETTANLSQYVGNHRTVEPVNYSGQLRYDARPYGLSLGNRTSAKPKYEVSYGDLDGG